MAVVINLSDPGAVPGASTCAASAGFVRSRIGGGELGSTRA